MVPVLQCRAGSEITEGPPTAYAWVSGDSPDPFPSAPASKAQPYQVLFLRTANTIICPVEGCQGRAVKCAKLHIHCIHFHVQYTIIVLEKGNFPCLSFLECDMFVPWNALSRRHPSMVMCMQGSERKRKRL